MRKYLMGFAYVILLAVVTAIVGVVDMVVLTNGAEEIDSMNQRVAESAQDLVKLEVRLRGAEEWSPVAVMAGVGDVVEVRETWLLPRGELLTYENVMSQNLVELSENSGWVDDETFVIEHSYSCRIGSFFEALRGCPGNYYRVFQNEMPLSLVVVIHPFYSFLRLPIAERIILIVVHILLFCVYFCGIRIAQLTMHDKLQKGGSSIGVIKT